MQNTIGDPPYPWDTTTAPYPWDIATSPHPPTVTIPSPTTTPTINVPYVNTPSISVGVTLEDIVLSEDFEEFVIWACGFTDPETPPSQERWEAFQKRIQQLAADFVAYKKQKREQEQQWGTSTYTTTGAVGSAVGATDATGATGPIGNLI